MNFDQLSLDPRLVSATRTAGYTTATPIQEQAIPLVLQGHDVLGLAQTGTGKTAAFMLPILNRLLATKPARPGAIRALVVAPTRELAEQIHQAVKQLGMNTRIRSVPIYGGVSKHAQVQQLRRNPEIVVACPGRLLDHVGDGTLDLTHVEVLVLDEADHMFDMGFLPDVRRILRLVSNRQQTLLFSATMPYEIRSLADSTLKDPQTVQVGHRAPAETISHALYPVPERMKSKLLMSMLEQTETRRVLIFTRTKRRARDLADMLERNGNNVTALQGNMAQAARQKAIDGFRSGKYSILVATDIAARGIDVTDISHVINYDMPDTVDAYTHRSGRTGRAYHNGEAFTLVAELDELQVRAVEKVMGERIERRRLDGFDYQGYPTDAPEIRTQASSSRWGQPRRGARRPSGGSTGYRAPSQESMTAATNAQQASRDSAASRQQAPQKGQPAQASNSAASSQRRRGQRYGRPSAA